MPSEIRFCEGELSRAQCKILYQWDDDIFQGASLSLKWQPKTSHILLYQRDVLVSHVGLLQHDVVIGNTSVCVAGIGGVVTVPEAQGKGFASLLMKHTHTLLEEWPVAAAMLFCRRQMEPFYARLGYSVLVEPVRVQQADTVIDMPVTAMIRMIDGHGWPPGDVHIPGLPW